MRKRLLPFAILFFGCGLAALLIMTGPKVTSKTPQVLPPLVRVLNVEPKTVQLRTITYGTVVPRTESELTPEVSGRVVMVSDALVSGGFFSRGQELLGIDPLDYEVALEEARARLARAESDLSNARKSHLRQLNLAKKQSTSASQRDDALNRLRIAEANLREAMAKLSRAKRDISRTRVVAPYDGRVRSERVDVGQFVNRGTPVAMIYATDFAEVRLPIQDDELAYLKLPFMFSQSSEQMIAPKVILRAKFAGQIHEWHGEVVRTEGELDPQTRMVYVIASVPAPYVQSDSRPPLSIGLFVEAEILGEKVDNIVQLPRSALHDNNRVYIIDDTNRLRFRDVQVLRVVKDEVLIMGGLVAGERVCVSALSIAVDGMRVRISSDAGSSVVSR